MELLRGSTATEALARLLAAHPVPAVAIDPGARAGGDLALLAIATPDQAILLDVRDTRDLGSLLAAADRPLAAWDAKAVHRALVRTFAAGPTRWACIRLCELLLAAGREVDLSLEAVAPRHAVEPPPPLDEGFEAFGAHARRLAAVIDRMIPALKRDEMTWVSRIEAAAVAPVAEMELAGMPFDADKWRTLTGAAQEERARVEQELRTQFASVSDSDLFGGSVLNLESDAEVKEALRALGHPVKNLRRATVAELPAPVGPLLARYRELTKLTSTYGNTFLEHVGSDGRIHPTFEQIGASTGRMACHSPNLQAVVKGGPHRHCFRAAEGRRLIIGDYATCELRILAEMSGDPVFADAFERGEDLHARVASEVFGKPVSKTENADLRGRAKAVNFGLAYGMGAAGLARAVDSDLRTAQQLLARYFETFPRIGSFLNDSAREAMERGYARTLTGRRLLLQPASDRWARGASERIAKNMPIQGTSADITKLALARLRQPLAELGGAAIVNTVHDEIVVECDEGQAEPALDILTAEMQRAGEEVLRRIPVVVDAAIARTWDK
jgi:DNA polymerase-1